MKTKRIILSVFAVLMASAVFATKLPSMKIVPVEAEKTIVSFETGSAAQFELSVKSLNGETLYYKKSEEPVENYRAVFDFSNLNSGCYQLSLSSGNCTLNRKLTISGKRIEVGDEVRLFAPVYSFENNLLNVSFLNMGQKNVFLNIYQDGNHISGKKLGNEVCLQKTFDFSNLGKGVYEVVLNDKFKEYSYHLEK